MSFVDSVESMMINGLAKPKEGFEFEKSGQMKLVVEQTAGQKDRERQTGGQTDRKTDRHTDRYHKL
jgi:hypothetical protein